MADPSDLLSRKFSPQKKKGIAKRKKLKVLSLLFLKFIRWKRHIFLSIEYYNFL